VRHALNQTTITLKIPDDLQVEGIIKNISEIGIGLVVSSDLYDKDLGLDSIGVSFSLPDADDEVDLSGTIRHKKLDIDTTWVGIEIGQDEKEKDLRADQEQKNILDYIMQRQRELLK
jgi:hypothetical protein